MATNEQDDVIEEDLSKLDDSTDWKAKAEELEQKRREDGIRSRERTKALKAQLEEAQKLKQPEKEKSDNSDYGRLLLEVKGITHEDDIAFVEKEAKDSGKPISEIVKFKYVQEHLKEAKDKRASLDATPSSKRTGQSTGKDSDYWYERYVSGEVKFSEVPKELRKEIVLRRETKEKTGGKYYNS